MKTFEETLKEFEAIIEEKYLPFRLIYADGIDIEEINSWCEKYDIAFHKDIITFYQWTNGPSSNTEYNWPFGSDTIYKHVNTRLFDGYWIMSIKYALEGLDSGTAYWLPDIEDGNTYIRLFNDDFGVPLIVNAATSAVSKVIDYGDIEVVYESLYEMIETITQRYRNETYKFYRHEETGEVEISFG
jgi:hypothetical protein